MTGRFFQRFEESVGRRSGDLVRFVHDVKFVGQLGGRVLHPLPQVADIVDTPVAGGVNFDDVGRRAAVDRDATLAPVARARVRIGIETVDRFCQESGRGRFTGAPWSAKEIRMSNPVQADRVAQRADDVFLTNQVRVIKRPWTILPVQ